ncbi:MAG: 5-(carboxyamino)imidazole ribonucleotide mutase [Deltaproteobacteria bacterium]|nr:5-(carboxyamino)imidazole ribonucleotide mutase [Nannocystaceae bacterium]
MTVAICVGSENDLAVMSTAADVLGQLAVPYQVHVMSAHRTPSRMLEFALGASQAGVRVIIAAAGGAAHLPGMMAAATLLPVIGVPIPTSSLGGMDSLLSIVQMPSGIPVATVAIGQATNAALLAAQILALGDPDLATRLGARRAETQRQVIEASERIEALYARKQAEPVA